MTDPISGDSIGVDPDLTTGPAPTDIPDEPAQENMENPDDPGSDTADDPDVLETGDAAPGLGSPDGADAR